MPNFFGFSALHLHFTTMIESFQMYNSVDKQKSEVIFKCSIKIGASFLRTRTNKNFPDFYRAENLKYLWFIFLPRCFTIY
jgi:hypothetical protein